MIRKLYFKKLLVLAFLALIVTACQNKTEQSAIEMKPVEALQTKKTKKDYTKKKGIELMAEYVANIMKPIDAEESTYKDGYMMTEHQKAIKNAPRNKSASIIKFAERGPVNVPGRIRGVVVAPDDVNTWYAGTVGGGLWVTRDAGTTWENLTDYKVPSLSTSTVAISKGDPNTIYVGTGEPFGNLDAIGGIGILKSINGGRSWEYLNNTKDFGGVGRLAIHPSDPNKLIVAANNGIYVTSDGGATWRNTYDGGNVQDLNFAPGCAILYAGVQNVGVIKSTNGGYNWKLVLDRNDYNAEHARFELDVSPANSDKVFVGVYTPSGNATTAVNTDFYVTDDAGETFTLLAYDGEPATGNLVTGQGWYDNLLMAHPYNENIFYAGGVVTYRVEVSGKPLTYTYQPIAAGYNGELNNYVHVDQHGLTYIPSEGKEKKFKLILSNDGGVYHTDYLTDPGTTLNDWSQAAVGLNCTQFYGADKRNGVQDYTAGAQDNGTWISFTGDSANDETEYNFIIGGDGFEVLWNYNDPNKFIGGSQFNGFARFVNGSGFNARHGESGSGTSPFYSKITNSNNNPDVVFSPSISGVWRSTNFAESWSLTPIPANFSVGASSALDVAVSTADPDVVWAGNAMTETGSYVMHVSTDNGISYQPTTIFADPRDDKAHNLFISGVETSSTNANRAYVLFSGQGAAKVLKTEDLGQTWEDISGFSTGEERGFPDVAIHSLVEMPFNENMLWVGTDIGVFQTLDGGKNWALLGGLPAFSVWQMKIVNNEVVMATHGRGVWTAELEELAGYEPPSYFTLPTLISATQESVEGQDAVINYIQTNENADAIVVYVDGEEVAQITDNIDQGVEYVYTINDLKEGSHSVGLEAIDSEGNASTMAIREFDIINFSDPAALVSVDTFEAKDVYTFGNEFVIDNLAGTVSKQVLNNAEHPYANGAEYSTVLKHPVLVSAANANFTYQDAAIVEPGPAPGRYYDIVTIEASSDLENWVQLDIYDASRFTEWTEAYNAGSGITDELFKEQTINLLDFFEEGDVIAMRFRLVTDGGVTSYGWAIRSINEGQQVARDEEEEVDEEPVVSLGNTTAPTIYPTASLGADFRISSPYTINNAVIEVYSLAGTLVYSKTIDVLDKSEQSLPLDLRSGMYLASIRGKNVTKKALRIIVL